MSDEKTEEPSDHKLKKAREEGQVAKSQDMVVAVSMLGVAGVLLLTAESAFHRLVAVVHQALEFGTDEMSLDVMLKRSGTMAIEGVLIVLPFTLAAAVGAIVGGIAQVGFQIATKAVEPKLDNINPAAGIKKVFSKKSLMTLLMTVLKAVALGAVMWQAALQALPLISGAAFQTPVTIGIVSWAAIVKMLLFAMGLFVVLGPVDYGIQRYLFMKEQRMSKDEVKREFKGQEGDPEIKQQRKEIAREAANEAPAPKTVARADAVVVNPTHYAAAIRYRPDEGGGLPVVLAKGVDAAALSLRAQAEAAGVPVFAHPPLARALHQVAIDGPIPEELFESVAVVLRWVNDIGARRDSAQPQ